MQTQDAIRARRNVRSYQPDPVPDADLDKIAEAAWLAPSASNRQHRIVIIVTDRKQLLELSRVWRGAGHIAKAPAAIALVVPKSDDDRTRLIDYFDLGQAMYAMTVAAADLGIGSGHASVGDQDAARAILGVPGDHDVAFLLGIGYPADRPLKPVAKPDRLPIAEIVRHGHW
jgi:nitroreductase